MTAREGERAAATRAIRIDAHAERSVFEGWGTSLAWWANAVGRWPRPDRDALVRRIFSVADSGLGLTVARFNAGGGENPGLEPTMQARAVMDGYRTAPDADLDKAADPGQRAVLREAARLVAEDGGELSVEVFGNSPPWWATFSGSVTGASTPGGRWPAPNLSPVFERDYLRYLRDVADFLERDTGIRVTSLSPFNEPTSRWWVLGGRQEGCHFTPGGIDRLLTELSEMPDGTDARTIAASEEWSLDQTLASWDALGPTARRTVGRLNTHSYDGESRSAVRARAARADVGLWVSEFGEGEPCGRELALAIVRDLRELAPNAWVLWQAVSPDAWGLLRFGRDAASVDVTPKFQVFARFTRSIRPGMRLVGTDDPMSVAAFGDKRFAAVIVGDPGAEQVVRVEVGAAVLGDVEVTITNAACAGPTTTQRAEADDGVVSFALPAGCIASLTAEATVGPDDDRYRGSGTWWLEHESGARLGLAAAGEDELGAGARVLGVAPDDRALAQRWRAEAYGDGSARWVCEASGHQLDIVHGSRRHGAHVIQWHAGLAESAAAHSRFEVLDAGGGAVALVARHSGLALALDDSGRGVQRPVGGPGTRWRLTRAVGLTGR